MPTRSPTFSPTFFGPSEGDGRHGSGFHPLHDTAATLRFGFFSPRGTTNLLDAPRILLEHHWCWGILHSVCVCVCARARSVKVPDACQESLWQLPTPAMAGVWIPYTCTLSHTEPLPRTSVVDLVSLGLGRLFNFWGVGVFNGSATRVLLSASRRKHFDAAIVYITQAKQLGMPIDPSPSQG